MIINFNELMKAYEEGHEEEVIELLAEIIGGEMYVSNELGKLNDSNLQTSGL